MSLELIGASESFAAKEPVAHKRPLAGVPPQVRLQMRRFTVNFTTAGDVTAVETFPPEAGARRTESLRLLAVRTVAGGSAGIAASR